MVNFILCVVLEIVFLSFWCGEKLVFSSHTRIALIHTSKIHYYVRPRKLIVAVKLSYPTRL